MTGARRLVLRPDAEQVDTLGSSTLRPAAKTFSQSPQRLSSAKHDHVISIAFTVHWSPHVPHAKALLLSAVILLTLIPGPSPTQP